MGFFGLFATIFSLGAMAKDGISDSINDAISRDNAIKKNKDFYLVNGYKIRSTKTGRDCTERKDYDSGHIWLCDLKTGERIVDRTESVNKDKTLKNKKTGMESGWKFYKTCEFDTSGSSSNVWVNDDMPRKYFKHSREINPKTGRFEICFREGELEDYKIGSKKYKRVNLNFNGYAYNPDGTINHDLSINYSKRKR